MKGFYGFINFILIPNVSTLVLIMLEFFDRGLAAPVPAPVDISICPKPGYLTQNDIGLDEVLLKCSDYCKEENVNGTIISVGLGNCNLCCQSRSAQEMANRTSVYMPATLGTVIAHPAFIAVSIIGSIAMAVLGAVLLAGFAAWKKREKTHQEKINHFETVIKDNTRSGPVENVDSTRSGTGIQVTAIQETSSCSSLDDSVVSESHELLESTVTSLIH